MKTEILKLLGNKKYSPMTIYEISSHLKLDSSRDFKLLSKKLIELEDNYEIMKSKKERYMLAENMGFYKGKIKINKNGFGFLIQDTDDIYIPRKYINDALDDDTVLVKKLDSSRGQRMEGKVVKVIDKAVNILVGTYQENKKTGYIILDDIKKSVAIDIDKSNKNGAVDGSKVIVEIVKKINGNKYLGVVKKIIGHKNDPGIDILSAVYAHNIDVEFSDDTINYLRYIPEFVNQDDIKDRRDLRDNIIVTIDGDDAKDLDDAISIEKLENNNYLLGVHIADVSYYVCENNPIDIDARNRGTSVYLVDRVIPMLPQYLSNNICSLNEGVDRLTLSCQMEIDSKGKIVSYDIFQSVINSSARMTYKDVNDILNNNQDVIAKYKKISNKFELMNELAHILRKVRNVRGSLDFEIPESKIIVDQESKVIDVVLRERYDAEKLIEDFMILANETVASHFFYQELPFIYRVHNKPKEDKITQFLKYARIMGHDIKTNNNEVTNHTIKNILDDIQDEQGYILKTLLLRSMQKAEYDITNIGHFGLASKCYTHFTSPIRRYPDLIVHRLIRKYLLKKDYKFNTKFISQLAEIALHSSVKERSAMNCEFDVMDMKKAEYMEAHIGEEFTGLICSLTNFGMFVELDNGIEGLIRFTDLIDDHYVYDEKRLCVYGKRGGKTYNLGMEVDVLVVNASKKTGQIDFDIVKT
ncbi:MAG: ribonuclease R [Bacilli bacterium]